MPMPFASTAPEKSKAMLLDALEDKPGAARDIVALNAGAGIYVAGLGGVRSPKA